MTLKITLHKEYTFCLFITKEQFECLMSAAKRNKKVKTQYYCKPYQFLKNWLTYTSPGCPWGFYVPVNEIHSCVGILANEKGQLEKELISSFAQAMQLYQKENPNAFDKEDFAKYI